MPKELPSSRDEREQRSDALTNKGAHSREKFTISLSVRRLIGIPRTITSHCGLVNESRACEEEVNLTIMTIQEDTEVMEIHTIQEHTEVMVGMEVMEDGMGMMKDIGVPTIEGGVEMMKNIEVLTIE